MCECSARNSESKPRSSSALPSASGRIPSSVTNVAIPNFMSPSNHGRGATGHSAGERELARRNVGCVKLSGMPDTTLTRAQVAAMVDHTLLKPEACGADVRALIDEARELGVRTVCVSPSMLPVESDGLALATVAGFPSGKHHSLIKGAEARLAIDQGAREIDMVIDIGAAVA